MLFSSFLQALRIFAPHAFATSPSPGIFPPSPGIDPSGPACEYVPGGCSPENEVINSVPAVAQLLVYTAAGLCVLFVIYGGAQMILGFSDESKNTQGRTCVFMSLIGFALALAAQSIISFIVARSGDAAGTGTAPTDNPIVAIIEEAISIMLSVFNLAFLIMSIVAGYRMVIGRGQSEELETAKRAVVWGIIGALVVNLARVMANIILDLGL